MGVNHSFGAYSIFKQFADHCYQQTINQSISIAFHTMVLDQIAAG